MKKAVAIILVITLLAGVIPALPAFAAAEEFSGGQLPVLMEETEGRKIGESGLQQNRLKFVAETQRTNESGIQKNSSEADDRTGDITYYGDFGVDENGVLWSYIGDEIDVVIPGNLGIVAIGNYVFTACNNYGINSVVIPEGVTEIGAGAFFLSGSLTSVTIPSSVTSIGDSAFDGCSGLTSIVVDTSNTVYASEAGTLYNKDKSLLIKCPAGKTGHYIILAGVTIIGAEAFSDCSGLTSMTISDSVVSIGDRAFSDCDGLMSVSIPNSVTSIGESAFWFCGGLTSLSIPDSVVSIGSYAFYRCECLTDVTIGNGVTSIGESTFTGCGGLANIDVANNNKVYASETGVLYNKDKSTLILYPVGKAGHFAIPNSVANIGSSAFSFCNGLTSVSIPNSVTSIGGYSFYYCRDLTSVTIPNSVTIIGDWAFSGCRCLTSVDIGNSLMSIGSYAFMYCNSLASITVPNSVMSIGENAFYSTAWYDNQPDGVVYAGKVAYKYKGDMPWDSIIVLQSDTKGIGAGAFYGCYRLMSVSIPNSVKIIGESAFNSCNVLTSVSIPNSVTSIGANTFGGCSNLTDIIVSSNNIAYSSQDGVLYTKDKNLLMQYPAGKTGHYAIPNSVVSIASFAFYLCNGLTSVSIPDSVTSIRNFSFYYCSGLTSVTIPDSVTSIEDNSFYCCTGLTSVTVPDSVTSIGDNAFRNCHSLMNMKIGNSVTSIGDGAFGECYGLTSVTIPNSVTNIGNFVFGDCHGLTSVTIPKSVTSIGDYLFYGCYNLTMYGVPNSTAHRYAKLYSILFVPIQFAIPIEGSGCIVNTEEAVIYGLAPGLTKAKLEAEYVQLEAGYTLEYSTLALGTGTVVSVVQNTNKSINGTVVASFTIIIFGDVNGDGNIDANDSGIVVDHENYVASWHPVDDSAFILASDVNGDGCIDSIDAGIMVDVENFGLTIDQTTGIVV